MAARNIAPAVAISNKSMKVTKVEPVWTRFGSIASERSAGAGGDVMREGAVPAAAVDVPPAWAALAQLFPAAVLDVHEGGLVAKVGERDLDLRRAGPVRGDVPPIAQSSRRLPDGDLAPIDLLARRGALEDPAARSPFEDHLEAVRLGDRRALRPPLRGARSPDLERVINWTLHRERETERFDHRLRRDGFVFSAKIRNRVAASPHT